MGKKGDNIKVLLEKARSGDVKELPSLTAAFTDWLRLSFREERNQPLVSQLLEKFLDILSKLIREIEKIENVYWKTKAVEMMSRLLEKIYTTRNLEPAVKQLEKLLHDFAGTSGEQAMVKRLENAIDLLEGQPQQTAVESLPANNRKYIQTRKKRGGCTTSSVGTRGGTKTIGNFIKDKIEDTIKDESLEVLDQPKGQFRTETIETFVKNTVEDVIKDEIKKILGQAQGKIEIETIDNFKISKIEEVIKEKVKETMEKIYPVTFRAHWKRYTMPNLETDLLVYLYNGLRGGDKKALDNFKESIKYPDIYEFSTSDPVYLKKGTEISIKPEMPGFLFEPSQSSIILRKDWHRVDFRMQPLPSLKGPFSELGEKIDGQVKFFVGPLLIGEIKITVTIKMDLPEIEKYIENKETGSAYQKIFASYAHEDSDIVEIIEEVYSAFGNKYMRDVKILRSGEEWEPTLLDLIKEADVFQLFWSKASKKSRYVKKEWLEALKRRKKYFIRPAYWEKPMPDPPSKLKKFHFRDIKNLIQMFKL